MIKKNSIIIVKDYFTEKRIAKIPIEELTKVPSLSEKTWVDDLIKDKNKKGIRAKAKGKKGLIIELISKILEIFS